MWSNSAVGLAVGCLVACAPTTDEPQAGAPATSVPADEAWSLREMAYAQSTVVIEIDTPTPERGLEFAREVVEPLADQFQEALVYIHRTGDPAALPVSRVRWTPSSGYEELVFTSGADAVPDVP